jgi:hypothetical protein
MMLVVILSLPAPPDPAPVSTPAGTEEFPFPVVTKKMF